MGFFTWVFGRNRPKAIRSAVLNGDVSTIQQMLQRWPYLSRTEYPGTGGTLLHDVAYYAHIRGFAQTQSAICLLLDSGADINAQAWDGKTALAIVCQDNSRELQTAALLLSRGANPNLLENTGVSAFHWSVRHRPVTDNGCRFLELMIRHGANVNLACSNSERNPFYCPGAAPIHLAVDDLRDPASSIYVGLLLKNGADPQALDSRGRVYTDPVR